MKSMTEQQAYCMNCQCLLTRQVWYENNEYSHTTAWIHFHNKSVECSPLLKSPSQTTMAEPQTCGYCEFMGDFTNNGVGDCAWERKTKARLPNSASFTFVNVLRDGWDCPCFQKRVRI